MTPPVKQWVERAEEDYLVAKSVLRSRSLTAYATVRFHAQQCAEKYLKALLELRQIEFPRTHDLVELAQLVSKEQPEWLLMNRQLDALSKAAVETRYPGTSSTREEARQAIEVATQVRRLARMSLKLSEQEKAESSRVRKKRR